MKQLNIGVPLTVSVFCFLLGTTNHLNAQKTKKDTTKNKQIEEVVVTALGIKRDQRKLGYAITKVETKDITQAGVVNPMEALQGKLPGVEISAGSGGPQSSARIQIRGNTSLGNNNQPLIVVDGVIIDNSITGADQWGSGYDFGNEMKNLNTDVFESVTVLRGAAASALYGSRAANGVIVITTKKGKDKNGLGVRINSSLTTQHVYEGPKFQNEFGAGTAPTFSTDVNGNRFVDASNFFRSYGPKFDGKPVKDIDGRTILWNPQPKNYRNLYQVGFDRKNSFEISGGDAKSTFLLSYTNQEAEGILPRNKFIKNAYYLRATHEFNKYLQIDASFNYNRSFGQNPVPQGGNSSPLFSFIYGLPRSFDAAYWRNNYLDPVKGGIRQDTADPYGMASTYFNIFQNTRTQKENNYIGRLDLKSQITDWLNLLVSGNFNNYNFVNESKILGENPGFSGGSYTVLEGTKEQYMVKFLLNGNFKLTDHLTLNASVGGEDFRSKYKASKQWTNGGLNSPGVFQLSNSIDPITNEPSYSDGQSPKRIQGLYAFANFAWKDQLFIDITGRNDWSSTLAYPDGHGSLSYFYPSFVGNWTFSNSFKLPKWINFGSLRGSLAWVGRDTSPYNTSSGLYYKPDPSAYNTPGGTRIPLTGFNSNSLANLNLKNELSKSIEFGVNMAFFNNRLDFDVSFYKTNTTNQLLTLSLPQESGISQQQINAGNLQNQGIEIIVNAVPVKSSDFRWNTTWTFSQNRDKILELYPGVTEYVINWGMGNDVKSIAIPGQQYGLIQTKYAYARYQAYDANGNKIDDPRNGMKVLKPNGTYLRSDSYQNQGYTTVGKSTPDFLTSFRNTLRYKNLSLSVLIDARVGGDLLSATYNYGVQFGNLASTLQYRDEEKGGIKYIDNAGNTQFGLIPEGVFAQGTEIKDKQGNTRQVGGMTYQEVYDKGWVNPVRTVGYYNNLSSWAGGIREHAIFENTWVSLREARLTYFFKPEMIKPLGLNTLNMSIIGRNLFYIYNKLPDGINPEGKYSNSAGSFAEYGGAPMSRYIGFNLDFSF
ncbi:SusC/RagA family TonB-linked outer membrane protein [Chryseobacterium lactis]|uniref:SusC/RagA family TonB-linked outer membrane protein n=1 Tax=Chryseobacterium lactis TaxID=1241981 RepID=A0A3G6RZJ4_CHRLC|nr:SusC/RagA family TonB-linked outer membrane protein [Chryseobacterium lactis]AZA82042.1 SusC/RagA family TonB-linked outer membrane protein [Chryseobacterium lactis]AZB07040.1 SusC/RagA family TonB-linked outer membrane protein [Chryseobacterium lactis]PNW14282.1 SusC/RagA family TonB-linked outer membrane protein [Chryseobacterium lactis]